MTRRGLRVASMLAALAVLAGCGGLLPKAAPPVVTYSLDEARTAPVVAALPMPSVEGLSPDPRPTLIVSATQAAPGFDGPRIVFVRQPPRLGSFALSEWVEPPARMLGPRIVAALAAGGAYRAVVAAPSVVRGELRLDTELVRLQQNFGDGPSRVRLTLRATLVDARTLRVIAWREFDAEQAAASEDARGGVVAAQDVVGRVLVALGGFCREATAAHARCTASRAGASANDCERSTERR